MTRTGFHFDEGRHVYSWNGEHIVNVSTPLRQQDTLIGGDLATWGARTAIDAILHHDLWRETDDERLTLAAMAAVTAKRDLGSKVHEDIERLLAGQRADPTPETAPYIYAYTSFLAAERPEFLAVEQRVVNLTERYAGTFDFLARIRGRVAMGDVKTGKLKLSHKLQLAGYSAAEGIASEGSADLTPLPAVQDHYVLLLRPDGYELVDLAVDDADRAHFIELTRNYHRMKAWDRQAAFLKVEEAA